MNEMNDSSWYIKSSWYWRQVIKYLLSLNLELFQLFWIITQRDIILRIKESFVSSFQFTILTRLSYISPGLNFWYLDSSQYLKKLKPAVCRLLKIVLVGQEYIQVNLIDKLNLQNLKVWASYSGNNITSNDDWYYIFFTLHSQIQRYTTAGWTIDVALQVWIDRSIHCAQYRSDRSTEWMPREYEIETGARVVVVNITTFRQ